MSAPTEWLDTICWNEQGLIPAITQDKKTGRVLTLAWMNREALQLTANKGVAVYWSRSRQKLWQKGESSGYTQTVEEIRVDCDRDAILLVVEQIGGIACHTGRASCFFLQLQNGTLKTIDPVLKDPEQIYRQIK